MKKLNSILAGLTLAVTAGFASASPFGVYSTSVTPQVLTLLASSSTPTNGQLTINTGSQITITYLGHSALYTNTLYQASFAGSVFVNQMANLDEVRTISGLTSPGTVPFTVTVDTNNDGITNYTLATGTNSVKLVELNGETFMGFEDNINWDGSAGGDLDYNDLVFKIAGATITPVAPIPEPSTYALMLAGLMSIGFVARRRAKKD
jgi:hypothetical protein